MALTETQYGVSKVPGWCKVGTGKKYLESIGQQCDVLKDEFDQATKASFTLVGPPDALPYIGTDRGLERYYNETDEDYAFRLWDAWSSKRLAGTDIGLLNQLKLATGLLNITIRNNRDWTPPDGNVAWWSRFWVVIGQPNPWKMHRWGEKFWGDGRLWGADISLSDLELLRRVIKKWKPSHAYCEAILIIFEDGTELSFPVRA